MICLCRKSYGTYTNFNLISEFSKVQDARPMISIQNSIVFLYISNEQSNHKIKKMIPFTKNIPKSWEGRMRWRRRKGRREDERE